MLSYILSNNKDAVFVHCGEYALFTTQKTSCQYSSKVAADIANYKNSSQSVFASKTWYTQSYKNSPNIIY